MVLPRLKQQHKPLLSFFAVGEKKEKEDNFNENSDIKSVSNNIYGKSDVVDNKWHHVCGTYDGSKARIFVDGVFENEIGAKGNIILCPHNAMIGRAARWSDRHFNGIIDEVAIYNRALTEREIKQDMKGVIAAVDKSGKLTTTWARLKF